MARSKGDAGTWGCIAACLLFIAWMFWMGFHPSKAGRANPSFAETEEMVAAFDAAKAKVSDQLASPGSAQFCPITDASIFKGPDGLYTVKGYVDSRNDYGALKRTDFTAKVSPDHSVYVELYPR